MGEKKVKVFSKRLSSSPLILAKNITSPQKQTKNKIKNKKFKWLKRGMD